MLGFSSSDVPGLVALVGGLSAVLTALVGLVGYRWSKQAIDAKDAQIAVLKEQIAAQKDQAPDTIRKQNQAVVESLNDEMSKLRSELSAMRTKLRDKSAALTDSENKLAQNYGISKLAFNISDYELELRRLSSFIMKSPWNPRVFPDGDDYAYEFYLKVVTFLRRDPEFAKGVVERASEWIMDYLFYPLLACMVEAPHLRDRADVIYQDFIDEIRAQGLLSDELQLYTDLQRMAKIGADFAALQQYSSYQTLMINQRGPAGYPYPMK